MKLALDANLFAHINAGRANEFAREHASCANENLRHPTSRGI